MNRVLYHITHRRNLDRILREGLQPQRARTKWSTVWLCAEERIADILQHMAERHHWPTSSLIVVRVNVSGRHLKRNRAPGVYHYPAEIVVERGDVFVWSRGELKRAFEE